MILDNLVFMDQKIIQVLWEISKIPKEIIQSLILPYTVIPCNCTDLNNYCYTKYSKPCRLCFIHNPQSLGIYITLDGPFIGRVKIDHYYAHYCDGCKCIINTCTYSRYMYSKYCKHHVYRYHRKTNKIMKRINYLLKHKLVTKNECLEFAKEMGHKYVIKNLNDNY